MGMIQVLCSSHSAAAQALVGVYIYRFPFHMSLINTSMEKMELLPNKI
jgi:hypothetical protein